VSNSSGFDRPNLAFDVVTVEGKRAVGRKRAALLRALEPVEARPGDRVLWDAQGHRGGGRADRGQGDRHGRLPRRPLPRPAPLRAEGVHRRVLLSIAERAGVAELQPGTGGDQRSSSGRLRPAQPGPGGQLSVATMIFPANRGLSKSELS
jgi:hypothetical protein